jgi:hypothetical protein
MSDLKRVHAERVKAVGEWEAVRMELTTPQDDVGLEVNRNVLTGLLGIGAFMVILGTMWKKFFGKAKTVVEKLSSTVTELEKEPKDKSGFSIPIDDFPEIELRGKMAWIARNSFTQATYEKALQEVEKVLESVEEIFGLFAQPNPKDGMVTQIEKMAAAMIADIKKAAGVLVETAVENVSVRVGYKALIAAFDIQGKDYANLMLRGQRLGDLAEALGKRAETVVGSLGDNPNPTLQEAAKKLTGVVGELRGVMSPISVNFALQITTTNFLIGRWAHFKDTNLTALGKLRSGMRDYLRKVREASPDIYRQYKSDYEQLLGDINAPGWTTGALACKDLMGRISHGRLYVAVIYKDVFEDKTLAAYVKAVLGGQYPVQVSTFDNKKKW